MLRNHDDLAYFENRDRYLLNSGLCIAFGRPAGRTAGRTPALILELCYYIIILDQYRTHT